MSWHSNSTSEPANVYRLPSQCFIPRTWCCYNQLLCSIFSFCFDLSDSHKAKILDELVVSSESPCPSGLTTFLKRNPGFICRLTSRILWTSRETSLVMHTVQNLATKNEMKLYACIWNSQISIPRAKQTSDDQVVPKSTSSRQLLCRRSLESLPNLDC